MGSDEGSESENTKITTVSASALSSFTGRGILPKRAMHFMASYSRKEWTEAKKEGISLTLENRVSGDP